MKNNNNFSLNKKNNKKKKSSSPTPIKKPKLQEEQKHILPPIPKHSIRYMLNKRAKEQRKKSNLMKNAKILKGIQAEEKILKFFRPSEKPFICKLLKFLRMNRDVFTWDDDTLEVNINGQDYPDSRIVDILSYFTYKNSNNLFYMTGDYDITDRLLLGILQNTIEVVKALNYLISSVGYNDLFQKLGFDMMKADRLGQIKRKKQIANTKQYNEKDLEAEEERAKRTMRQFLGIMGELQDQYDRDKKSYSDGKYSAFIQRE